jgi:virginiamycin A acetyltransferase
MALRRVSYRMAGASPTPATLGPGVKLAPGSKLTEGTTIGAHTRVNGPASVRGEGPVSIGKWCAIGQDLRILSSNHVTTYANLQLDLDEMLGIEPHIETRGGVEIGDNVWIGDRVLVVTGARVGAGTVIGAGSVVASSLPPLCIAVGVPARPVRARFADDVCAALLEIAWWDWPLDRIRRNVAFFSTDLTTQSADEVRALVVP